MSNSFNLEFIDKCIKLSDDFKLSPCGSVILAPGSCKIKKIELINKKNKKLRDLWKHIFYELLLQKALDNTDYINIKKSKREKERLIQKHLSAVISV